MEWEIGEGRESVMSRLGFSRLRVTALAGVLAACSSGGSDGGTMLGPGDGGADSETTSGSAYDDECEGIDFPIAGHPPVFLIVLDRSGSMKLSQAWDHAVESISYFTSTMDQQCEFGLLLFPDGLKLCGQPPEIPNVPVAEINSAEIGAMLEGTAPQGGGTPTTKALQHGYSYLIGLEDDNPKYVVLATDGAPNCSQDPMLTCDNGCVSSVGECNHDEVCLDDQAAYAKVSEYHDSWGIDTYVLGLSGLDPQWEYVMSQLALCGGTGDFYFSDSPQQIKDALQEIAAENTECEFDVDWDSLGEGTSTDPELVNVEADGQEMPYSEGCADAHGWRWLDDDSFELCQDLCHDYKWGVVQSIRASFGCATYVE